MICSKCNHQIVEGAKFCMSCGAPVVAKAFCMGCGTELPPEAKFCPSCGTGRSAAPPSAKTDKSKDALTFYNQGLEYFNQKDYRRAIECYEKSIQIGLPNPNDSGMYFNLGYSYNEIGNYARAIECYEKTVRIDPNNSAAYNNLGNAYGSLSNFDKRLENYWKAANLGNESTYQWLKDNGYCDDAVDDDDDDQYDDDDDSEPVPDNSRQGPSQYSEKDHIIKTMRAEGVDPEYAEDYVFQNYVKRYIWKESKCTRCGGKLNFLKKCKSCGASVTGGGL